MSACRNSGKKSIPATSESFPVAQPGALLYVGDGHALQGDGELNGNALETSLDVEFSVDVVRQKSLSAALALGVLLTCERAFACSSGLRLRQYNGK